MKTRLPIYLSALSCLIIGGAGDAAAFHRLGPMNNMHGHRTAPPKYHAIRITKPSFGAHTIKIGTPTFQAKPRQ
jgi:hypothetical protein